MLSLQIQLIKSEAFETVSVCQCDSGSNNKATAQLPTVDWNTPHTAIWKHKPKPYLKHTQR